MKSSIVKLPPVKKVQIKLEYLKQTYNDVPILGDYSLHDFFTEANEINLKRFMELNYKNALKLCHPESPLKLENSFEAYQDLTKAYSENAALEIEKIYEQLRKGYDEKIQTNL